MDLHIKKLNHNVIIKEVLYLILQRWKRIKEKIDHQLPMMILILFLEIVKYVLKLMI